MGEIVYYTLIRTLITIAFLWFIRSYLDFQLWIIISLLGVYLVIIHPAISSYKKFMERSRDVVDSTLCASCKHFDESAVLCLKYDQHPTEDYIPCEGSAWEPNS